MKNKKWIRLFLLLFAFFIFGTIFSCQSKDLSEDEIVLSDTENETLQMKTEAEAHLSTPPQTEKVCVYVCGCVKEPGIYYVKADARVKDAVEAAGGFSEDAAKEHINLASNVSDGEMILIPSVDETKEAEEIDNKGFDVAKDLISDDDGLIDINKASKEELMTLPGIGEVKAEAVISYREDAGGFTSIDEIMNVSGIGEASFEKIKENIKV